MFWIFMSVWIVCETVMYLKGHDTTFYKHKTPAELELQQKALGK